MFASCGKKNAPFAASRRPISHCGTKPKAEKEESFSSSHRKWVMFAGGWQSESEPGRGTATENLFPKSRLNYSADFNVATSATSHLPWDYRVRPRARAVFLVKTRGVLHANKKKDCLGDPFFCQQTLTVTTSVVARSWEAKADTISGHGFDGWIMWRPSLLLQTGVIYWKDSKLWIIYTPKHVNLGPKNLLYCCCETARPHAEHVQKWGFVKAFGGARRVGGVQGWWTWFNILYLQFLIEQMMQHNFCYER